MKRYLIFTYDEYYPGGGQNDVTADVDTLEEVKAVLDQIKQESGGMRPEFVDVLDMQERTWLTDPEFAGTYTGPRYS